MINLIISLIRIIFLIEFIRLTIYITRVFSRVIQVTELLSTISFLLDELFKTGLYSKIYETFFCYKFLLFTCKYTIRTKIRFVAPKHVNHFTRNYFVVYKINIVRHISLKNL